MSFSRLQDFEKCRYLAKLKYVDRIPEPERPLPPGKTEHANDRGSRIHEAAEAYVRGGVELIEELSSFKTDFDELRELFAKGIVSLEGEWAVNREWAPVAWKSNDAWCRMKLDAFVRTNQHTARVIDYKTGRKVGNEVKHTEQGQIYQLSAFMRYPDLEDVTVEFWYTDQNDKDVKRYTRTQGVMYLEKYDKRLAAMTECTDFKPNPNAYSCKWCPYKGNACEHGITHTLPARPRQFAR